MTVAASLVLAVAAPASAQVSTRDIARTVLPSVVTIHTYDDAGKLRGNGSGFVVRADGLVMTNSHVIAEAESAGVTFANGRRARVLGVIAADTDKDYALIQVEAEGLTPVRLSARGEPEIGEKVVAVGAPLGLSGTVSEGIVSQLRQQDRDDATATGRIMIQHTAAISPGNSGGPLVNDRAEVIGVNTEQATQGQNLNFALPVVYVRPALQGDLRVRQDLPAYRRLLAEQQRARAVEAVRKAFTLYEDPDGLLTFLSPRGWSVQRQVAPHTESGGTVVTVMVHAPEAEHARLVGWLSEGMRFTLLLPPKGRIWTDTYRRDWATAALRSMLESYDRVEASDPAEAQLGNVKTVGVAVTGKSSRLQQPEVGGLFVLAEKNVLLRIELAMPVERAEVLKVLTASVAASLKVSVAQ